MLIIKDKQINSLEAILSKQFKVKTMKHLLEKHPKEFTNKSDDEIMSFISKGINCAYKYKITEQNDVVVFLTYMLNLGHDFDKDPKYETLHKILKIRNLEGNEKIRRMLIKTPIELKII